MEGGVANEPSRQIFDNSAINITLFDNKAANNQQQANKNQS